ncbi:MAG: carbon-nitrogen hydrolase family protein [Microbacterium sp.]
MARPVTVSCLTAAALPLGRDVPVEDAVHAEIAHWIDRIDAVLPHNPDLIVLPEAADRPQITMFGSDRQAEYFRVRGTRVRDALGEVARENGCNIAYSAQQVGEDFARNRTEYLDRTGSVVGAYDKNHLVIREHDHTGLEYGTETPVFDLDFGRVATVICFDLNFDELRHAYQNRGVELIVFSSEYHGSLMQNYWAYSLRAYLAASIRPPAPSAIVSPLGETIAEGTNYFPEVTRTINLDYAVAHLDDNWSRLAAAKRKYQDGLGIHDPGRLGSVLITAESPDLTATDILEEFEIETLDHYLARSRAHRQQSLERR